MSSHSKTFLAVTTFSLVALHAFGVSASEKAFGDAAFETQLNRFSVQLTERAGGDVKRAKSSREQLVGMYLSLPQASRETFLADLTSADEPKFFRMINSMPSLLAESGAFSLKNPTVEVNDAQSVDGVQSRQKLASGDNEYIFIPTTPCRVADTRNWIGPIAAATARQMWVWSNGSGFSWATDQGGTGTAGVGDCAATYFASGVAPVAVMATVTAVPAGGSSGHLRAWQGDATLTSTSILNFVGSTVTANTTIIPVLRTGAPYTGSGSKRDIAVYNGSGANADVVVDVVGYYTKPAAYALTCTNVDSTALVSATTGFKAVSAPACPAGQTMTGVMCSFSGTSGASLQSSGYGSSTTCEWGQTTATSFSFIARARCCAMP